MKIVVKEPNKNAEIREVDTTNGVLSAMQVLVSGYVQSVDIGPVSILCDEDGLAKNRPDNCGFVGTIVFVENVWISEEEGYDWGSLSDENARKALAWCQKYYAEPHPDRSGKATVIFNENEIEQYRSKLAMDAKSKLMEWQSL